MLAFVLRCIILVTVTIIQIVNAVHLWFIVFRLTEMNSSLGFAFEFFDDKKQYETKNTSTLLLWPFRIFNEKAIQR